MPPDIAERLTEHAGWLTMVRILRIRQKHGPETYRGLEGQEELPPVFSYPFVGANPEIVDRLWAKKAVDKIQQS
jgi:hypothetical protein